MIEFYINKFISIKYLQPYTLIYIAGKRFKQCKRIIIEFEENSSEIFKDAKSIDEVVENYRDFSINSEIYEEKNGELRLKEKSNQIKLITPKEEFWCHCSNLQAWVENNYNSNLIHSNLAFPLLKELVKAGDLKAKNVFLEEILKRVSGGYKPVIDSLFEGGFLNHISSETLLLNMIEIKEAECLLELEKILKIKFNYVPTINRQLKSIYYPEIRKIRKFTMKDKHVLELNLYGCGLKEIPEQVLKLEKLKGLKLNNNELENLNYALNDLGNLEWLIIENNKLKEISSEIKVVKNLKILNLNKNEITKLSNSIGELKNLENLSIRNNKVKDLTESISNLKKLKILELSYNPLSKLPEIIGEVKSLEYLGLKNTNINELPKSINQLKKLKTIDLSDTKIKDPISLLSNLKSLKEVYLSSDQKERLKDDIKINFNKKNINFI